MMNKHICDIFIFAGEDSGDIQGEMILQGIFQQKPDIKVVGVLGPKMRAFPAREILAMEEFRVMGFIDVLKSLKKLKKHFFFVKSEILKLNPKTVVLIDYPGFNLKMAKHLRNSGFKGQIIQHVCPTVWAWKKGRIKTMERYLNTLICLFPFEKKCFSNAILDTKYIGHPLVNKIKEYTYQPFDLPNEVISIFPGSRDKEVLSNLPLQLKTAARFVKNTHEIIISCVNPKHEKFIQKQIRLYPEIRAKILSSKHNYEIMQASKLSIATSGTITLELALHKIPTIVTYFIKPLDFFIARKIFKIDLPHYCIVNYLANQRIFPEHFGPHFNEDMLFESFQYFFESIQERKICISSLNRISKMLYNSSPSKECADVILSSS